VSLVTLETVSVVFSFRQQPFHSIRADVPHGGRKTRLFFKPACKTFECFGKNVTLLFPRINPY